MQGDFVRNKMDAQQARGKQQAFARAGIPTPQAIQQYALPPQQVSQENPEFEAMLAKMMDSAGPGDLPKSTPTQNNARPNKNSSFGTAFKNARAAGEKEFEWNGKRYNTKLKEDAQTNSNGGEMNLALQKAGPVDADEGDMGITMDQAPQDEGIVGSILAALGIGGAVGAGSKIGDALGFGKTGVGAKKARPVSTTGTAAPQSNGFEGTREPLGPNQTDWIDKNLDNTLDLTDEVGREIIDADLYGNPKSALDMEMTGSNKALDEAVNRTMGPNAIDKEARAILKKVLNGSIKAERASQAIQELGDVKGAKQALKLLTKMF